MSYRAWDWVWETPARGVRQHVLFALARHHNQKTGQCNPSLSEIAAETGIGVSTVRGHLRSLEADGIITTRITNGGRRQRSSYTLLRDGVPLSGNTRQQRAGFENDATRQEPSPVKTGNPPAAGGDTDRNPPAPAQNPPAAGDVGLRPKGATSEQGTTGAADATPAASTGELFEVRDEDRKPESLNQICRRLATAYCDLEPMSKFPAVMSIAKKAIDAGFVPDDIESALVRLAKDGRGVTTESLRVELCGFAPARTQPRRVSSPGDERAMGWQSLKTGTDDVRALPQRGANWR